VKRQLGQNFLRDPNILDVIGRTAELSTQDVVLEIGGGEGMLSAYLAPRTAHLHVVEIDKRLREALHSSVEGYEHVQLHWGDAMRLDLTAFIPAPTKVVANLPYSIAAGVLLRTIELLPTVGLWVAMVQREVGQRLAAPSGDGTYGVSSVLAQLAAEVSVVRAIPRTVFQPMPNVDSVLVRMQRTGPAAPPPLRELVRGAFAHRRKALAGSLALAGLPFAREDVRAALVRLDHPADARAERLSPRDFRELARILQE
jgi:16S rRNA (adenine1518-N6/adenine1519-N6)-dimethyltransferase